jgi:copper chaperone CopZ
MATTTLRIENMHCGACIRRVTQTLNGLAGTKVEDVQIGGAHVESTVEPEVILAALAKAGYPARVE